MGGKVFAESSNIYQDEAKILFDYYKKAAETIVAEEKRIEGEIDQRNRNIADLKQNSEKLKKQKLLGLIGAGIGLVLGIVLLIAEMVGLGIVGFVLMAAGLVFFLIKNSEFKKNEAKIPEQQKQIADLEQEKKNIRRDYKVSKLGVAYVPVASRVPFEGKSFMVDYTGNVDNTRFAISVLHKPDEFKESLNVLEEKLSNVPVVESNENAEEIDSSSYSPSMQNVTMHDYVGTIDREVRNISYLLSDSDTLSVSLPVIEPNSSEDDFIKEYATQDVEGKPVVNVFDISDFDQKLKKFSDINEAKKTINAQSGEGGNVRYFKKLIKQLGDSVQVLTEVKTNSLSKLLTFYEQKVLNYVFKSGYNHYSPNLEADEIERIRTSTFNFQDGGEDYQPFNLKQSSRVKFNLTKFQWEAEDGTMTFSPFGMHQIQEEVLMPVLTNLLNETRIERLKIYNNIKDQKMSYLNKWNQDIELAFRDNRARGQELVTEITNAYAEYNTAYNTYKSYKNTLDKMSQGRSEGMVEETHNEEEQIAGFETQALQCNRTRDEFQAFMDRLTEDIDRKGEEFNRIELYEASLRDSLSRDFAQAQHADTMQNLDERRRRLVEANPYYAANADLPPMPTIEPALSQDFIIRVNQEAAEALRVIEEKEKGIVDFEDDFPEEEVEEEPAEDEEEVIIVEDETEEEISEEEPEEEEPEEELEEEDPEEEFEEEEPAEEEFEEEAEEEISDEEPEEEELEEEESEVPEDEESEEEEPEEEEPVEEEFDEEEPEEEDEELDEEADEEEIPEEDFDEEEPEEDFDDDSDEKRD